MDWIGHHGDIAQWGLGTDLSGPVTFEGSAPDDREGIYDTPKSYKIECEYANGVKMTVANEFAMKTLKGTQVNVTRDGQAQPENILTGNDCAKIRNTCDKTYRTALKEENHYVVSAVGAGAMHVGQLMQMINQHGQSETSYEAQGEAAEAQLEQADASRKEKDYDETKSLEDAAQAVIDAARQTMQKSYESQHEAAKEIFG